MDICSFRDYCLSLPLAEETLPFDENTLVFKIGGKIFAAAEIGDFRHFAVKCDPDEAILLRDRFPEIRPPKYFNKRHWNAIGTSCRSRAISPKRCFGSKSKSLFVW